MLNLLRICFFPTVTEKQGKNELKSNDWAGGQYFNLKIIFHCPPSKIKSGVYILGQKRNLFSPLS
jgi:hypothetical protein